jgi:hypothetical protein
MLKNEAKKVFMEGYEAGWEDCNNFWINKSDSSFEEWWHALDNDMKEKEE